MPENIISRMGKFVKENRDLMGVIDGKEAFCGPSMLHIDLTNMCNNNCIACWCRSPLLKDKEMHPDVKLQTLPKKIILGILDDAYAMGTKNVKFVGGGEPFMHPDVMELIRHAAKKGFSLDINTNFTLVTEERAKQLVDFGVDILTVSVWAATPKTYKDTHPSQNENALPKIEKALKFLNDYKRKTGKGKPVVKIFNVIFNRNYKELQKMIDFAMRTGSDQVQFVAMDPIPGRTDVLLLNNKQRESLFSEIEKIKKNIEPVSQTIISPKREPALIMVSLEEFERRMRSEGAEKGVYDKDVIKRVPCYAGWMFSRVMANGNVVPCCKGFQKPMGSVYEHTFSEIWNGEKQNEFRHNGITLPLTHPYFAPIGCVRTCDNLWQNEPMHERLNSLHPVEKAILKSQISYLKLKKKLAAEKRPKKAKRQNA